MALVLYYKDMLEKVTTQRTQQFSAFSLLPEEPSQMQRVNETQVSKTVFSHLNTARLRKNTNYNISHYILPCQPQNKRRFSVKL